MDSFLKDVNQFIKDLKNNHFNDEKIFRYSFTMDENCKNLNDSDDFENEIGTENIMVSSVNFRSSETGKFLELKFANQIYNDYVGRKIIRKIKDNLNKQKYAEVKIVEKDEYGGYKEVEIDSIYDFLMIIRP